MTTQKNSAGYTVVEALIVLAVMGMIFISTSLLIRGQVAKFQYRESMDELAQIMQNTVRDTENGYFSSNTDTSATRNGPTPTVPGSDTAKTMQGKRIAFCSNTATDQFCGAGNTKYRVDNIKGDPSNHFEYINSTTATLPGALQYIGSYWPDVVPPSPADASAAGTGFNVLFSNLVGSGNDTATGGNVFGKQIGFTQQAVKMYTYQVEGMVANCGGSAVLSDPCILRGMTADQEMAAVNGGNGRAACFEGYRRGSITFGKGGSLSLVVNYDDAKCKSASQGGLF